MNEGLDHIAIAVNNFLKHLSNNDALPIFITSDALIIDFSDLITVT
jgi:hypothetical protein